MPDFPDAERPSNALAVIVHHNNEVTIHDERGYPAVCRDCRFAGWRSAASYQRDSEPPRCLYHSGGADPVDGDRVMERLCYSYDSDDNKAWSPNGRFGKLYPLCKDKNPDGKCKDFVRAKPLTWTPPWRLDFWRKLLGRDWRTRRMRL